jgi:hypothetical protein
LVLQLCFLPLRSLLLLRFIRSLELKIETCLSLLKINRSGKDSRVYKALNIVAYSNAILYFAWHPFQSSIVAFRVSGSTLLSHVKPTTFKPKAFPF